MAPSSHLTIGTPEPWVTVEMEGKSIEFLLDTGATYSILLSNPGILSNRHVTVRKVIGKPINKYFSQPFGCLWGNLMFSHSFLIIRENPTPLLGRDIMNELGTIIFLAPESIPTCLPMIEAGINPDIWTTQGAIGHALIATLVHIHLKDPTLFPCWKQYPLKPKAWKGLIPIINNLKRQGLLRECNSSCNTPILGIPKPNGEWRLVQDPRAISEAVTPIHPIVPNPYTLLAQITETVRWFTVLDLKDAFFCIPIHPDS